MKNTARILSLITLLFLSSCSKDEGPVPVKETPKSSAKQITSFMFNSADNEALEIDIPGVIDQVAKSITAKVPFGTDFSALKPELKYSDKAIVGSLGARDFSSSVSYEVTAEDGSKTTYAVSVIVLPSNENQIALFQFLLADNSLDVNVVGEINHEAGTIIFNVPDGADITALIPSIQLPEGASISPQGAQDFKEEVVYTITAANGTTTQYTVSGNYSQRGILLEIYNANPGNDLEWSLDDPNIGNWDGVTVDDNGNIYELLLTDAYLQTIPPEIGQLSSLSVLHLMYNDITQLPPEIGQLGSLTELYIEYIAITELPAEIGQLSSLTSLYIENNDLLTQLPPEIGQLGSLTKLDLENNDLLTQLPPEIGQLGSLSELDLGSNKLTELPPEIGQLGSLSVLDLRFNKLTQLPPEIGQLGRLSVLSINGNDITQLPTEIGKLGSLTELNLDNNQLTELPPEIGQLGSLNELSLHDNDITQLPPEIGQLSSLTVLFLNGNDMLTSIPAAVCAMPRAYGTIILTDLNLSVACEE